MASGDAARAAGLATVDGSTALVINGDDEINNTRDMIANVMTSILAVWPLSRGGTGATDAAGARTALGISGVISVGTAMPSGGSNGDIYFKYTP